MDIPWRTALIVVAAAFIVFLLAKMLPGRARAAGGGASLSAAKGKVRAAKTERERAEALCEAAASAMVLPLTFGGTRAAAYFLRAMRADPTWPGSVEKAAAALTARRGHALEKILWRRLAATPWDAAHRDVLRALVKALADVSKRLRGHSGQAGIMERLLAGEVLSLPKAP